MSQIYGADKYPEKITELRTAISILELRIKEAELSRRGFRDELLMNTIPVRIWTKK